MNTLDPRYRLTTWQRIKLYVFNHATWDEIQFRLKGVEIAKSGIKFHSSMRELYQGQYDKAVRWHKRRSHILLRLERHTNQLLSAEAYLKKCTDELSKIGSKL